MTCCSKVKRGFSLLEVMLALAILGIAAATLGEVMRNALRSAERAHDDTRGTSLCQSTLSELAAGVIPLEAQGPSPYPDESNWVYQVEVNQSTQVGMVQVVVTAIHQVTGEAHPNQCRLVRLMRDPSFVPSRVEAAAAGAGS